MKKTFIRMAALAATLSLLTACGADSTSTPAASTPATATPTTTIMVTDMQGGYTDITGVWVRPCFANITTGDFRLLEEFSGTNTYRLIINTYTTTDGSCGGTATTTGTQTGTFGYSTNVTATGWIDGFGNSIAAPTAQDGISTLPATPAASGLKITIATATGSETIPTKNPFVIQYAVDASNPASIALYEVLNGGVNGWVAEAVKLTRQ